MIYVRDLISYLQRLPQDAIVLERDGDDLVTVVTPEVASFTVMGAPVVLLEHADNPTRYRPDSRPNPDDPDGLWPLAIPDDPL